jgi:hypothetical protein
VRSLFWNPEQNRLRALWRLAATALLLGALILLVGFVLGFIFSLAAAAGALVIEETSALLDSLDNPLVRLLSATIGFVAITLAAWLAARRIDHRPFADLGFRVDRDWWADLGFGLALGALLMLGIFVLQWTAGWIEVTGIFRPAEASWPFLLALLPPVAIYLSVGIQEELLLRGYVLQNLAEGLNLPALGARGATLLAWLLSSAIFGLAHVGNPNTTVVSTLNLALAGLFLGLGYILTGELALPIGLHITWNFFQGVVFGFPVSGLSPTTTFIVTAEQGPDLWTGGPFGPEAGLSGILALLVGSALILWWVRRRYGRLALADRVPQPPPIEPQT